MMIMIDEGLFVFHRYGCLKSKLTRLMGGNTPTGDIISMLFISTDPISHLLLFSLLSTVSGLFT
jgi:hypothetical protein